jgi:hypothetical protein
MSRTRDGMNMAALTRMLGGRPPRESADQPLAVAAAGAGGGSGGGLSAWSRSLTIEATLSAGLLYYYNAGWSALSPSIGQRAVIALCTAVDTAADPDTATLLLAGEFARTGTPGAPLYAGTAGAITEAFPGDEDDTTTGAPWVWPIGWQYTADLAILLPCEPYRPRKLTYCLADGVTQLALNMRECPADP